MFWSGETLLERLPALSKDFRSSAVDCNAWTLTIGKKIYITPTAADAKSGKHTIQDLNYGESFQIPPGQFAFLQTWEKIKIPNSAMAFISVKASIKLKGLINVSGFHVDPGYEGVLIFTVYNAGPSPIHLHQGQPCFLIWFASLDNEKTTFIKKSPSFKEVDGNTVGPVSMSQQSFDDFLSRLKKAENKIVIIETIGKFVIGAIVTLALGWVSIQLKKDAAPLAAVPTQRSVTSDQITTAPVIGSPVQGPPPSGNALPASSGGAQTSLPAAAQNPSAPLHITPGNTRP